MHRKGGPAAGGFSSSLLVVTVRGKRLDRLEQVETQPKVRGLEVVTLFLGDVL